MANKTELTQDDVPYLTVSIEVLELLDESMRVNAIACKELANES